MFSHMSVSPRGVSVQGSLCPGRSLSGHWYPCFGLLVTPSLGFKARVGSALFALGGGVYVLHLPWELPLVWHLLTSWRQEFEVYIFSSRKYRNKNGNVVSNTCDTCAFSVTLLEYYGVNELLSHPRQKHWSYLFLTDLTKTCTTDRQSSDLDSCSISQYIFS